ncbi:propanediol utilization protein [Rhodovulum sp. DZ06]|uniref:propanediol utilization protein n=1 Tax=Rhodovulum sp. DZ06 TaxID=3425126 RepID=UPI003D345E54
MSQPEPGVPPAPARAVARAPGHWGEWMQGRIGENGPVALITLPCPALSLSAEARPGPLSAAVEIAAPPGDASAPGAPPAVFVPMQAGEAAPVLRALLSALSLPEASFRFRAPMPPGAGAGFSTAALVAAARAAAALHGREAPGPGALAAACLAAEGASDPLWAPAPDALLWASRKAQALEVLPPPPPAEIIGGLWGAPEATNPADDRFPDISDLVGPWRAAAGAGDLPALARLAAASADRCTALRGPSGDPTADLARALGALGHARAHTGPARGLVFAPGTVPDGAGDALRAAGFERVFRFTSGSAAGRPAAPMGDADDAPDDAPGAATPGPRA